MEWRSLKDVELEHYGSEQSDIILRTDATKCKVCKTGDVTPSTDKKKEGTFMIYTRDGTSTAKHQEYRCNNRQLPCRAGHFYGYVTMGEKGNEEKPKCFEKFALKKDFLITSSQTAFSAPYLWDSLLQIVFSNASFESLAKIYNNLHFVNLPDDVMARRVEVHRKRIAEAIFIFAYLELGQRYGLPLIISGGIDATILRNRTDIRDKFREIWSVDHRCEKIGCSSVLIVDGGMKPTRALCAAKLNGLKEFSKSGMVVVVGCQKIPQPDSKYCGEHVGLASPALTAENVTDTTRIKLREHRAETSATKDAPQDQIYVIESILEKKEENETHYFKVKWLGFPSDQSTWEPARNIQPWIQTFYSEDPQRLGKPLPEPRIKYTKKAGDEVYHYLSWEGGEGETLSRWVGESFFSLASNDGEIVSQLEEDKSCNTKKTKDKRDRRYCVFIILKNILSLYCRHLVGILAGTKPCGTVVLFEELYGSESLTQG